MVLWEGNMACIYMLQTSQAVMYHKARHIDTRCRDARLTPCYRLRNTRAWQHGITLSYASTLDTTIEPSTTLVPLLYLGTRSALSGPLATHPLSPSEPCLRGYHCLPGAREIRPERVETGAEELGCTTREVAAEGEPLAGAATTTAPRPALSACLAALVTKLRCRAPVSSSREAGIERCRASH
eukprot:3163813-Rhodomonas_salina.3